MMVRSRREGRIDANAIDVASGPQTIDCTCLPGKPWSSVSIDTDPDGSPLGLIEPFV